MDQIWLAGAPHLAPVLARREDVGLLQPFLVEVGLVRLHSVEDVFEADHGNLPKPVNDRSSSGNWGPGVGRRGRLGVDPDSRPPIPDPRLPTPGTRFAEHASRWRP